MKNARTRIGRVTMRAGGADVRVLHSNVVSDERKAIESVVRSVLNAFKNDKLGGFAFVVWNTDLASMADLNCFSDGSIPEILIPDYVRNLLLEKHIETLTIDTVNESWGRPPDQ